GVSDQSIPTKITPPPSLDDLEPGGVRGALMDRCSIGTTSHQPSAPRLPAGARSSPRTLKSWRSRCSPRRWLGEQSHSLAARKPLGRVGRRFGLGAFGRIRLGGLTPPVVAALQHAEDRLHLGVADRLIAELPS